MYAIILKQKGDGCDYMIGCGMEMFPLQSRTLEEALKEAKDTVQGKPNDESSYGFEGGFLVDVERGVQNLEFAKLIQIECDLPIIDWYHEGMDKAYALGRKAQLENERAEYERLKAKYG